MRPPPGCGPFLSLGGNLPKKRMEPRRRLYQRCPPDSISLARMTWSAGQNSYWGISSTVIQRMSLCSSFWGVPSAMEAWNRVRHSHKNASKWVKLYLFYPISDPLNFNSELFMSLSIVTSNMKRQIIILNIFARGKLIVLNCKLHSSTN